MQEKLCPLMAMISEMNRNSNPPYCLKKQCAWWCAKDKACSMATIATAESMLVSYVQRINRIVNRQ